MPSNPGAGRIFIDQSLEEGLFIKVEPSGQATQKRPQEVRPGRGRLHSTPLQIIAASEGGDLSEALVAHVLIGPETQPLQLLYHRRLLGRRQDIRPIVEALRNNRTGGVPEQVGLEHGRHSASSPGDAPDAPDDSPGDAFSRLERVTPTSRTPRVGG